MAFWYDEAMFRVWLRSLAVSFLIGTSALAQEPIPKDGNPSPDYPPAAKRARIAGDVWFRAYITEEGTVQGVEVTRVPAKNMGFEDSVVPVIKNWSFEPARRGSMTLAKWFEGYVRFSLKAEEEEEIRTVADRAEMAWNKSEIQVLASLFTDEAHVHTVTEDPARGPYAIGRRFSELLTTTLKGARVRMSVDMIRFFQEGRAEVEYTFQLTGGVESIGRFSTTFTQTDDEWLIDHAVLIEGASVLWDTDPVVEFRPLEPALPPEAKANNVSGQVLLGIIVRRDGTTEVVKVLQGLPHGCTEAAVENARLWRYKPALREGQPVEATGTIWVNFGEAK
jgi:uncharacterized protein (TIGR02246 family)